VPRLVRPMAPSVAAGEPPTGPDWRVEVAWTGHRCVAYVHPPGPGRAGRVRLLSGADNSMTHTYPEFTAPLLARCPPGGMVLDGTVVARGEEHAVRPRLLKRRHSRYKPSERDIAAVPVDLQVADLLFFDGHDTTGLPFRERRALLEGLGLASAPVWTTALFPSTELDSIMRIAAAEGVDAFHARHLGARYRPGGRSKFWLRVPVQRTRQVVIGGWTPTDPRRPDTIAALLLGIPDGPGLRYVGRVGVGVEQRRQLGADLRGGARDDSPFTGPVPPDAARHAVWVTPDLVGLVEFTGWVGGIRMRLPRWRGLARLDDLDDSQWAVPTAPAPAPDEPSAPAPPVTEEPPAPPAAVGEPAAPPDPADVRRLEQHFVYNSLNTIAALIRTDPLRARELLFGFADLSRTADGPPESTVSREFDAVRAYLQIEQARFGPRLRVEVELDDEVGPVPVPTMRVLSVVREAVQKGIEPLREGGLLSVSARRVDGGCEVAVTAAGETARLRFPAGR
jgi:bifunctional non-homologous end joining protein LigD